MEPQSKTSPTPHLSAPLRRAESTSRHRILLIEDNADSAESMRLLLELAGHEVQVAHDGPAGLERARSFQPRYVVCDIGLPGPLSGYAVAQSFRSDPALERTIMIALTGYGDSENQQRSLEAGFDAHVTKPVGYRDLMHLLDSLPARPERTST